MALSKPARSFSLAANFLLALAGALYLVTLGLMASFGSSLRAGAGTGPAAIAEIGLWIVIGMLVVVCCRGARLGIAAKMAVAVMIPLAAVAALVATRLQQHAADWIIIVPVGLPLLAVLFALWARRTVPGQRRAWLVAIGIAVIAIALIVASVVRFRIDVILDPAREAAERAAVAAIEKQRADAVAAAQAAVDARFTALNRESRLDDFIDFVLPGDARAQEALAIARKAKTRQADAVRLLGEGRIRDLAWLHDANLKVTPTLCLAYPAAIAWHLRERDPEGGATIGALLELEPQLPNMHWLSEGGCDLRPVAGALARRVRHVADTPESEAFATALETLQPS